MKIRRAFWLGLLMSFIAGLVIILGSRKKRSV
jgi:hypothetical protein